MIFKLRIIAHLPGYIHGGICSPHHFSILENLENYAIGIFTHLKLRLADAIHNFKRVKIIQISQRG